MERGPVLLNCENCRTELVGEYCHSCGQSGRPIKTSFTGFIHDLFTSILGTDSRLIRSLRRLVLCPGCLTKEWIEGHRNRYTTPIQLYLLMASAFFLLNAYNPFIQFTPADHSILSSLPGAQVKLQLTETQLARLEEIDVPLDVFKERFNTRVAALLGPLLIMTLVLFSLLNGVVIRRGHPFAHHAVFSLHWCSFFLLLVLIHRMVNAGRIGEVTTVLLGMAYLVIATAKVYGGWLRAIIVGPILMLIFLSLTGIWMAVTLWTALP